MPRFKDYNYDQTKLIPVSFEHQILPGTFEYSVMYLVEHELDLSCFEVRYNNDEMGRPAYDPAILLKIVLLAYSRGTTSSRKMEHLCRENILFMAISADSRPHFTTLADFISGSAEQIAELFVQVLMVCDAEGLIGREMFAIDGCKLASDASKEWSGTKADLRKKKRKIDRAVRYLLKQHQQADHEKQEDALLERAAQQRRKLRQTSRKIQQFLSHNEDRRGVSGRIVQSNITDPDSAKMKTSHGVIQGYTGVAAVDAKHQVIVQAQAYGQGQEHGLLEPTIEQAHDNLNHNEEQRRSVKITADSGYHNERALDYLEEQGIDGYIADTGFRSRDPRFKDAIRHKSEARPKPGKRFAVGDFKVDLEKRSCICPAGKAMWLRSAKAGIKHHVFMQFQAHKHDCPVCPLKRRCLKTSRQKTPRQIHVKLGITHERQAGVLEKMKQKIDSAPGRHIYSQRLGTVEPVFGDITGAIGIRRFSFRGKVKVNMQWQLMAIIHNIGKIHRYGPGFA